MSLLTMTQNVADETLIAERPTSVIGNADKFARQCLSLLNKVGDEIKEKHAWETLIKEENLVTDGSGSYIIGTDVFTDGDYESFVSESGWNATQNRSMDLLNSRQWQNLINSTISNTGITTFFRIRNNDLLIKEDNSGDTLNMEYRSSFWITNSSLTPQAAFSDDTDTSLFPEDLLETGLRYYLKIQRGLPAVVEFDLYIDKIARLQALDIPREIIGPKPNRLFLVNIPDTGVGL